MMNGKQRGLRLSDFISELQHYLSRTKTAVEAPEVQAAINKLHDARQKAHEDPNKE